MDAIRVRGLNETCSPLSKRRSPMQSNNPIPVVVHDNITDDYGNTVSVSRVVSYVDSVSDVYKAFSMIDE